MEILRPQGGDLKVVSDVPAPQRRSGAEVRGKILTVCQQNVGRSPTAMAELNRRYGPGTAESAGTRVMHSNQTLAERAVFTPIANHVVQAALDEMGLSLGQEVQTQLTRKMLYGAESDDPSEYYGVFKPVVEPGYGEGEQFDSEYDLVLVMAQQETVPKYLGRLMVMTESGLAVPGLPQAEYLAIDDPVLGGYDDVVRMQEQIVEALDSSERVQQWAQSQ
jgi:hypothetical protein